MLPTKQNVEKAINVRFKGALLTSVIEIEDGRLIAGFIAPEGRTWPAPCEHTEHRDNYDVLWARGRNGVSLRTEKPVKKQELWSLCLEFIKTIPELEPAPFKKPQGLNTTPPETMLDIRDPDFRFPTGAELTEAIEFLGLNYTKFCAMFDVDSRSLSRWRKVESHVPYALWRLILLYSGKIEI